MNFKKPPYDDVLAFKAYKAMAQSCKRLKLNYAAICREAIQKEINQAELGEMYERNEKRSSKAVRIKRKSYSQ